MVTVQTGPISAQDSPAEVPVDKWHLLIGARRSFAQINLPYDCRELLRFIDEARKFDMIAKLDYTDEDDFIRRGLELEPETVREALFMLDRMKPDWAVPYKQAAEIGTALRATAGAPKGNQNRAKYKNNSRNARIESLGASQTAANIRARLERDAADIEHPDRREIATRLLPRIITGELSAHAAAIIAGFRARMIQIAPTVDGFERAIRKRLDAAEQNELRKRLEPPCPT